MEFKDLYAFSEAVSKDIDCEDGSNGTLVKKMFSQKAMMVELLQLHFHLMVGTLSLGLMIRQSECGMLIQVRAS